MKVKCIILFCMIFLLCGCTVKNDNIITINNDGSFSFDILIAFDKDLLSNAMDLDNITNNTNNSYDIDQMKKFIDEKNKISFLDDIPKTFYYDENYVGYKYNYYVENINSITSDGCNSIVINDYDSSEKLIDKKLFCIKDNIYKANFIYQSNSNNEYSNVEYLNTFIVNLPNKSVENNAMKETSKTLIWNINENENYDINFSFKIINYDLITSLFLIFIDVILLIALLFTIKWWKKVKS